MLHLILKSYANACWLNYEQDTLSCELDGSDIPEGQRMSIQAAVKGILRVLVQNIDQIASSAGQSAAPTVKGIGLRPVHNRGVLFRLFLVAISSLYFGGYIAHKGASYLEENEIFVPADDDDDDD
ncbi:unnamed protein product [Cylicocyclus nassatus]|uniref:Essential MCU regulator, mitochondrial n=1 Tax=Cylicocyclus nassatus TaxID=53992 RepID=A0AA36MEB0_CYLNA|nr:unnamed protein product [Cylicocyclus nassatus]